MVESYQMDLDQATGWEGLSPILSAIIGEKDCLWDFEFRAFSIEGWRKVLTMISIWDEV